MAKQNISHVEIFHHTKNRRFKLKEIKKKQNIRKIIA